MTDQPHDLTAPLAPFPGGPDEVHYPDALISGGLVVIAGTVPRVEDGTAVPVLVFRFAKPDGSGDFHPAIILEVDSSVREHAAQLIDDAIAAADDQVRRS